MIGRLAAVLTVALGVAAAGHPGDGASTLGKRLDLVHDGVVAVFAERSTPAPGAATGTLIDPRVVVTAGHVSPRPATGLPSWIVSVGPRLSNPIAQIRVAPETGSRPNPSFLAFVDANGRNPNERPDFLDIGLFLLPEAARVRPTALPTARMLDHLSKTDRLIGVGFGYHEVINARTAGTSQPSDGQRRSWLVGARVLNEAWIQLDDDPAKGYGQICRGDSGAPILLERGGRETLVAVVSHSDGNDCGPGVPTYAVRVDNPAVLAWIATEIADTRSR